MFFSLDELNNALGYWMEKLNDKTTRTYPKSRLQRFLELDAPALRALRVDPYPYSRWRYHVRVGETYHVEFQQHFYSVPCSYAHRYVDIRVSDEKVDVHCKRRLIASHAFSSSPGWTTLPEHMPPQHRYYLEGTPEMILEWAESVGPSTSEFMQKCLSEHRHFAKRLKSAALFRKDVRNNHWQDRVESACAYTLKLNCFSFERLRTILKTHADQKPVLLDAAYKFKAFEHENLRGAEYYALPEGGI